jgi:hypothetical protein
MFQFSGNIEELIDFLKNNGYPNCKYSEFNIHGNDELFLYHYKNDLYFRGFEIPLNAILTFDGTDIKIT